MPMVVYTDEEVIEQCERAEAAAIVRERERCAKIADKFLRDEPIIQDTVGEAQHVTAKAIASAIRQTVSHG